MQKDIFVTGTGIISSIGNNVDQCYESLINKRSGIRPINILQTIHSHTFKAGEIKYTNIQLLDLLEISHKLLNQYTRTTLLGLIAAKEAFSNAGLDIQNPLYKTGLVSANTVGGMDKTEIEISNPNSNLDFLYTHPSGDSTNKICDHLGINGYRTTISTACSSGINAIIHGIKLIDHGILDRVIVGGTDALSKFTLNGFNSLMILDKNPCKPFDKNRKGLSLGEGAGYLVIESSDSVNQRQIKPICKITGFANTNDAFHQTASSPNGDGAYMAMDQAIKMSGRSVEDIDYINAHGTGTPNNDLSEGIALKRIFDSHIPDFSSTKSYIGHTLGAAGGIESVFSVLALKKNVRFPNLNFQTPIDEINIKPITSVIYSETKNVLSNAFGFGGNNSSIVFSK